MFGAMSWLVAAGFGLVLTLSLSWARIEVGAGRVGVSGWRLSVNHDQGRLAKRTSVRLAARPELARLIILRRA